MNYELLQQAVEKYSGAMVYPYDMMLKIFGFELFYDFCLEFGGSSIYVPKAHGAFAGCIYEQIRAEYNVHNMREICKDYGVCTKTVLNIIRR